MSEYVTADEINVGDVLETQYGHAWRKVTDVRTPSHPAAEATGALVVDSCLWGDGRMMPPLTIFPGTTVRRVRTASQDQVQS